MNEDSIRSVERIYKRRFIVGIAIAVITLVLFLISFINASFIESVYMPIDENLANQFSKGIANPINILVLVLLMILSISSAILCRVRKRVGLKLGCVIGLLFVVFGLFGLFKIGFGPFNSSSSSIFLYAISIFGLIVFIYYAIIGLARLNIMRAKMVGKSQPNTNTNKASKTYSKSSSNTKYTDDGVVEEYTTTNVYTDEDYNETTTVEHSESGWSSYKEY